MKVEVEISAEDLAMIRERYSSLQGFLDYGIEKMHIAPMTMEEEIAWLNKYVYKTTTRKI